MYKITSQKNSRRFLIILLSHYLRNYKFNNIILISREISCCFSSKLISQSAIISISCQMKRNLNIKNIFSVILSQLHYLRNETIRPHGSPDQQFLAIQIQVYLHFERKYRRKAWKNLSCNYRYYLQLQRVLIMLHLY